ncbi:MAG: SDR family oxidoreductase, partial [Planctomycetota bacterium]|nr:SDR family oxidoreductase [Planctomycetota bacterium]
LGEALVKALGEHGAGVCFCDIDVEKGKTIENNCENSQFSKVDLLNEIEIRQWVKQSAALNGQIDVLINNAAADPRIEFDAMTTEQWDTLFSRNIRAYFITSQESRKYFPNTGGAIINFSSITIHKSPASMEAYVSTKAATIGFSQSLARELGPQNVRVNTLSPGWIMTERQLKQFVSPQIKKMLKKEQCIPKLIQPAEIANVALFLASNLSAAITGQEILVDRGWASAG